ncbi:hypothetical protein VNI00_018844 [Paramarasmius palmivorus]|uniref:Uncharacterized protein n=1 Tax=Paramarasmius palmivorus TaxID=297713 RepID=A0AAW0ATK7_9AGAR
MSRLKLAWEILTQRTDIDSDNLQRREYFATTMELEPEIEHTASISPLAPVSSAESPQHVSPVNPPCQLDDKLASGADVDNSSDKHMNGLIIEIQSLKKTNETTEHKLNRMSLKHATLHANYVQIHKERNIVTTMQVAISID